MQALFIYLLKANGLIIVFWLIYRSCLRKETFYAYNRWYFLVSVFCSLLAPLYTFTRFVPVEQDSALVDLPSLSNSTYIANEEQVAQSLSPILGWQHMLFYMLIAISLFKLLRVLFSMLKLVRYIRKLPSLHQAHIKVSNKSEPVYSFYRWIVVPENLLHRADAQIILDHETLHLDQRHTFDLILIELVAAVFWFDPFIKLFQKDLITNLEFIVDQQMVKKYERVLYQKSLINAQVQGPSTFANQFGNQDLKRRILQINTQISNKMNKLKFLIALSALAVFFVLFQVKTVAKDRSGKVKEVPETSYIIRNDLTEQDLQKLTKMLKDDFNIDLTITNVSYNGNKISALDYELRNERYKISSSTNSLEGSIDPLMITVDLNGPKPFSVVKVEEDHLDKTAHSYTIDNDDDAHFALSNEDWDDKRWIEKISKDQSVLYLVDGIASSEAEVRSFNNSELMSINIHRDKETREKYNRRADNIVIIKTKKQLKVID